MGQIVHFWQLKWPPFGHFWSDREKIATMLIPIDRRIIEGGNSKIYFGRVFLREKHFCNLFENFLSQKLMAAKKYFFPKTLEIVWNAQKNHFEWNLNIFDFWPPNFGGFGPPWPKTFNALRVLMGVLLYIHNTFWCHIPHRFRVICHFMRRSRVPKNAKRGQMATLQNPRFAKIIHMKLLMGLLITPKIQPTGPIGGAMRRILRFFY